MRKYQLLYLAIWVTVLSGCRHDSPEWVGQYVDYSQMPSHGRTFIVTSEQDRVIEDNVSLPFGDQELQVSDESMSPARTASSLNSVALARGLLSSLAGESVHQVCGTYETVNASGQPIHVSGAIFYPVGKPAKNILLVSHYTISANYEAPSQTFPLEAYLASKGYVVIMPDYIGYGATVDSVHPYLQNYLTGVNVIDMLYASYPFLNKRGIQVQSDSVILAGYSQGGVTSAFVQQIIETDDSYNDILIKKNYCGGGPYYPYVTYWAYRKKDVSAIPYAMPMTIAGMALGRDTVLSLDFFFQDWLLQNYNEWFVTKKYNGQQINRLMGTNKLSEMLKPQAFNDTLETMQQFFAELQENGMAPGYIPKAPMYVFHSTKDNVVPFANADTLRTRWQDAGPVAAVVYDFNDYGNHMNGFLNFFFGVLWKEL